MRRAYGAVETDMGDHKTGPQEGGVVGGQPVCVCLRG